MTLFQFYKLRNLFRYAIMTFNFNFTAKMFVLLDLFHTYSFGCGFNITILGLLIAFKSLFFIIKFHIITTIIIIGKKGIWVGFGEHILLLLL